MLMYFIRCYLFTFLLSCEREGRKTGINKVGLSAFCQDSSLISTSVAILDFIARLYI